MKLNPMIIVVAVLVVGGVFYYLQHHKINVSVDIKSDEGSKSHMNLKHDQPPVKD